MTANFCQCTTTDSIVLQWRVVLWCESVAVAVDTAKLWGRRSRPRAKALTRDRGEKRTNCKYSEVEKPACSKERKGTSACGEGEDVKSRQEVEEKGRGKEKRNERLSRRTWRREK